MKGPDGRIACTVKVGEKGQIVIPKEARELFNINPGDTLLLLADEKRGLAIPLKEEFTRITDALLDGSKEKGVDK